MRSSSGCESKRAASHLTLFMRAALFARNAPLLASKRAGNGSPKGRDLRASSRRTWYEEEPGLTRLRTLVSSARRSGMTFTRPARRVHHRGETSPRRPNSDQLPEPALPARPSSREKQPYAPGRVHCVARHKLLGQRRGRPRAESPQSASRSDPARREGWRRSRSLRSVERSRGRCPVGGARRSGRFSRPGSI